MKTSKRKRKYRHRKIILAVCIVAVCIGLLFGAYHLVMNGKWFGGDEGLISNTDPFVGEKYINILIVGIDNSEERNQMLTDVMMIAHYDLENNEVRILQIPRDTWTDANSFHKMNTIYGHTDEKNRIIGLANELADDLQLPIDYYVTITMDGFRRAIDAIGGVEVDVPFSFEFPKAGTGYWIYEGRQTLDGVHAEWFVRYRSGFVTGDVGRIQNMQRIFVSALADQLTKLDSGDLMNLVTSVFGEFTTNFTLNDLLSLASRAHGLDLSKVEMYMIPGEGYGPSYSYYTAHKEELALLLNAKFRTYTDPVPADELQIVEKANTTAYLDDNGNTIEDILSGEKPGSGSISYKEDESSSSSSSSGKND